jgi:HlyD family secretion protein
MLGLILAATAVTGTTVFYSISQFSPAPPPPTPRPTTRQITALGRLQPEAEVVKVSAPASLNNDRVAELLVQQGDRLQAGQTIAILDSRDRLQTARSEAKQQVAVAEAKLAQVKAGAKSGEIVAQQAQIARLEAELQGDIATQAAEIARWQAEVNTTRTEYDRFLALYREGAIAASNLDQKRLAWETAVAQLQQAQAHQNRSRDSLQAQIREARATLDRIAEVRPVDVQAALAEVAQVTAAAQRAEAELQQAYIRAPMAGQILAVHTRAGEAVGNEGIVDLAQTNRMEVVAEVYQTDIRQVRPGQAVAITSESFPGKLQGTVRTIGLQVSQQQVLSNQPGENLDRRVVEVRIRLKPQDSQQVAALTNLQVQVAIHP